MLAWVTYGRMVSYCLDVTMRGRVFVCLHATRVARRTGVCSCEPQHIVLHVFHYTWQ